jgi:acyl-CoA thioester hydrolase
MTLFGFESGPFTVRSEWIDSNGHLNLAYYILLFDEATDALWRSLGLGDAFRATGFGTFAVETHTLYRAELMESEAVTVGSVVLGADGKRLHVAHEMRRVRDGAISAQQELLYLCVNLGTRRATNWPAEMAAGLAERVGAAPEWVGRRVVMPPSPSGATQTGRA